MVEIMSQVKSRETLKLPKNIRQIGLPEEKKKIYIEDYVVTYMNQLALEYPNRQSAAILLGFYTKQKDTQLTFINGAIGIPSAKVDEDQVSFDSYLWEEIYETIRKYFQNSEIVGWFLTRPGKSLGINEKITKIHVDQFPGKEKTLFLMDPLDKEDAFFIYENGKLTRQHGYYIYYERNEDMQSYMVEQGKGKATEDMLEAAHVHKEIPKHQRLNINQEKGKKTRGGKMKIVGTVVAAMALVVVGMNVMNLFLDKPSSQTVSGNTISETKTIKVTEHAIQADNVIETSFEMKETESLLFEDAEDSVTANVNTGIRYTVREGDTLANICIGLYNSQDYVDVICEMNDIEDPDVIYEGMILELP